MPPRFGNVGYRSSSSSSGRSPGTARQQQQRSQRTSSRGAQRGVSGKTTYVTPKLTSKKKEIDQIIKTQQDEKIDTWVPTKEIIPKEIDHGFDTIAQRYYNNSNLWWIIAKANELSKGEIAPDPLKQLRIPIEIDDVLESVELSNS